MKCFHCKIDIDGEPVLDLGKGKTPNFTLHERCARMLFGLPDEPKIDFTHLVGPDVRVMADYFEQYMNYNKGDVIVVDSVFSDSLNQGKCSKVAPSKFFRGLTNA